MFSVDNFYDFFISYYGWDRTKTTVPWITTRHGSKDLQDFLPRLDTDQETNTCWYKRGILAKTNTLILHDQEIFIEGYSAQLLKQHWNDDFFSNVLDDELLYYHFYSLGWPIFCHSQYKSQSVANLERSGMIPCHYFWHGMVSRDWFRHWRHHQKLQSYQIDKPYRFLLYSRDHTGLRVYRHRMIRQLAPFQQNILYNWNAIAPPPNMNIQNEWDKVGSAYSACIDVDDALAANIHLVAETVFDQDMIHATEKIFKPMVMLQPFIVFGNAGLLEYIRSYGFKTFDGLWDESYDKEPDSDRRMNMIIDQVKKLNELDPADFRLLMQRCQNIVLHNRKHFFSDEFENQMLDELHHNMHKCLTEQQQRNIDDPGGSLMAVLSAWHQRGLLAGFPSGSQDTFNYALRDVAMNDWDRYWKIQEKYQAIIKPLMA